MFKKIMDVLDPKIISKIIDSDDKTVKIVCYQYKTRTNLNHIAIYTDNTIIPLINEAFSKDNNNENIDTNVPFVIPCPDVYNPNIKIINSHIINISFESFECKTILYSIDTNKIIFEKDEDGYDINYPLHAENKNLFIISGLNESFLYYKDRWLLSFRGFQSVFEYKKHIKSYILDKFSKFDSFIIINELDLSLTNVNYNLISSKGDKLIVADSNNRYLLNYSGKIVSKPYKKIEFVYSNEKDSFYIGIEMNSKLINNQSLFTGNNKIIIENKCIEYISGPIIKFGNTLAMNNDELYNIDTGKSISINDITIIKESINGNFIRVIKDNNKYNIMNYNFEYIFKNDYDLIEMNDKKLYKAIRNDKTYILDLINTFQEYEMKEYNFKINGESKSLYYTYISKSDVFIVSLGSFIGNAVELKDELLKIYDKSDSNYEYINQINNLLKLSKSNL